MNIKSKLFYRSKLYNSIYWSLRENTLDYWIEKINDNESHYYNSRWIWFRKTMSPKEVDEQIQKLNWPNEKEYVSLMLLDKNRLRDKVTVYYWYKSFFLDRHEWLKKILFYLF